MAGEIASAGSLMRWKLLSSKKQSHWLVQPEPFGAMGRIGGSRAFAVCEWHAAGSRGVPSPLIC